ncbi:lumenal Hsp70 protein [Exophiala xenobiotica]|uniref:Lumenal Hsp70 protein n=1 Tax=Lithohypha guttulata TaxID=1690604 RepID=A0ABR0KFF2_9EURO|nr:lumenal Hsp70 protein [Lithohypha guttulata]KAK5316940.1 lumenal Hsp70 protein [Exophiala xenobiotica]
MPPPGRRKAFSINLLSLLLLLVFSIGANAASAALGIDFGTEYIKAAVARPGSPIDIVLTKDSKRKEAATLAFKPSRAQSNDQDAYPERLYGGDALAVAARYPADVYPNLKTLLGISPSERAAKDYSNRFPSLQIQSIERDDGGRSVGFKSQNLGKPVPLIVEELVAMELQNIKANAEALVGKNNFVSDAVITYPAFYTAEEKRALELAAKLAGLRVLGLISDGQAVGLNYATTRAFDPKKKDAQPEINVVYDMGAGSTTATVLKFHGKNIKGPGKKNQTVQEVQVLGIGYDQHLGGDALNDLIVQDMISKFLETKKVKAQGVESIHVKKDGKTMARLWKDAEKVRQVLSANQQASASFEGLFYEDINFKYTLTRSDFEQLADSYALRIAAPLSSALSMADLTLSDISSVILHGGLTRTPFVQSEVEKAAGAASKVKTNINADEAAAFGAAFKAAGLSPSFRVKDIRTADIAGSSYTMKWTADGKERSQKIFLETSQVGAEKQVTVKGIEDLQIQFLQTAPNQETSRPVLTVEAANLTKSANELRTNYGCADSNITTVLTIRLNQHNGLPEIASGVVSCEAQIVREGGMMNNVKGMFGFGSKKEKQQPLEAEDGTLGEDLAAETPLPVDDPTSSGSIVSEATATSGGPAVPSTSVKSKPSTAAIPLSLKTTITGAGAPPREALPVIKQRLIAFDISDRSAMLRSEALNVLEAFTYRARDYLQDESFAMYSTEKARKELEKQLSKVSDWLYSGGSDAKLQEFKDKLQDLKALVDPVLKRKEEGGKRDEAVETLRNSLNNASSMMDMIRGMMQKAAQDASSSVSSAASSEISPSADDLEDEPYASTSNGASETEPLIAKPYEYTEEDLSGIEKVYDSAKSWLEEKVTAQGKLSPYEDPAVLVSELEAKAKQVGTAVSDVVMKQIKMQQAPKAKKSKSSKKPKQTKSTSTVSDGTGSTVEATVSATASVRDEL